MPVTTNGSWVISQNAQNLRENVRKLGAQAAQVSDAALLSEADAMMRAGAAIAQAVDDMVRAAPDDEALAAMWAGYVGTVSVYNNRLNDMMLRLMSAPRGAAPVSFLQIGIPEVTRAQVAEAASVHISAVQALALNAPPAVQVAEERLVERVLLSGGAEPVQEIGPVYTSLPQVNLIARPAATPAATDAQKLIAAGLLVKLLTMVF